MGIKLTTLHLLTRTLSSCGDLSDKRLLTLGVQGCHLTYEESIGFLRRHGINHEPVAPAEILLDFRIERSRNDVPLIAKYGVHQKTLFRLLGFVERNVQAMDISSYEGADITHDLNVPVDSALHSGFDLIFDGGTVEHVFSLKDALFNICRMCKVGGTVIHFSPVDCLNHGFVNFNVSLLQDCYLANGFEEVALSYVATPNHPWWVDRYCVCFQVDDFHFSLQPYYSTMLYAAYRKVEERPLVVPQQGFYRRLWDAGPGAGNWNKPNWRALWSRKMREYATAYFVPAIVLRGTVAIRKGQRVFL